MGHDETGSVANLTLTGEYPANASGQIRKILLSLGDTSLIHKPTELADILERLQAWWAALTEADKEVFFRVAAHFLAIRKNRFRQLLRIESKAELVRALEPTTQREWIRVTEEEQLYPTSGWLGEYLEWVHESEVPLGYHFWCGVGAIAASLRRNAWIDRGNHIIWPNHYILIIGPSGVKKSQALRTAIDVVEKANHILEEEHVPEADRIDVMPSKITPERLVQRLRKNIRTRADVTKVRTLLPDCCAFWPISELAVLLGKSNVGSEKLIHLITDLYDSPDRFETSTIIRGDDTLYNVALTMVGCSTATWVRETISRKIMTGGFAGRCLFIYRRSAERLFAEPGRVDPVRGWQLAEGLARFATMPKRPAERDPEVIDYMEAWYRENYEEVHKSKTMEGYFQRKDGHIYKLALILAVSDNSFPRIRLKHVEMARKIIDFEEPKMFECLAVMKRRHAGSSEYERHVRKVYDYLVRANGRMSHNVLVQKYRDNHKHKGDVAALVLGIIETLEELGAVRKIYRKKLPGERSRRLVYEIIDHDPDWDRLFGILERRKARVLKARAKLLEDARGQGA